MKVPDREVLGPTAHGIGATFGFDMRSFADARVP
jgi:hypothetical protein